MKYPPPTTDELIKIFNAILDDIVTGRNKWCPTDTGLDQETCDILNLLGAQPNPKLPSDIAACRIEFARMLDGTHTREAAEEETAEWTKLLSEQ